MAVMTGRCLWLCSRGSQLLTSVLTQPFRLTLGQHSRTCHLLRTENFAVYPRTLSVAVGPHTVVINSSTIDHNCRPKWSFRHYIAVPHSGLPSSRAGLTICPLYVAALRKRNGLLGSNAQVRTVTKYSKLGKWKTVKAVAKRFIRTGSGKLKYWPAGKHHNMLAKSRKRSRQLRKARYVNKTQLKTLNKMISGW